MGIPGNSGRSDIRYVCCLLWLSRQAVCALRRLINSSTVLTQASASLERVKELMDEPYDIVDRPDAKTLKTAGQIEFDRVSFKYNDAPVGCFKI